MPRCLSILIRMPEMFVRPLLQPLRLLVLAGLVAGGPGLFAANAREGSVVQVPAAVRQVDLQRYSGRWYELARLPNSFQRNCALDALADYTLVGVDRFQVVSQCTRRDGTVDVSVGVARQAFAAAAGVKDGPGQGVFQLRFAPRWLSWWPAVWGDYWILALDERYETALVGTPDRAYLWLLSRSPRRSEAAIEAWLQKAAELGYPVDRVVRTAQDEAAPVAADSLPGQQGSPLSVQPEADWSEPAPAAAAPAP